MASTKIPDPQPSERRIFFRGPLTPRGFRKVFDNYKQPGTVNDGVSPPLLPISQISPGSSRPSLSLYLSCLLLRHYSNGMASTGSSLATLHHHSPSTRPRHAKSIHSQPHHHRSHQRRTTITPQVRHPIVRCLWIACGRAFGRRRNDRWQLSLPRSSPLNVTVGRQHHRRCQLGHLSLTNRTSSQRNYKKENPSKLTPPCTPLFPPTHHSRFPSHVTRISHNQPLIYSDRDPDRCFLL